MKNLFSAFLVLLASANAAMAGTKSFIVPGTDLETTNGGALQGAVHTYDGVALADAGFSGFALNFTLPSDYKKNTPVAIQLRMYGAGDACTVRLYAKATVRYRPGRDVTTEDVGLKNNGDDLFTVPSLLRLVTRGSTLRKAGNGTLIAGSIRDQLAGDGITAFYTRQGVADSCTRSVVVTSAKITYTTN